MVMAMEIPLQMESLLLHQKALWPEQIVMTTMIRSILPNQKFAMAWIIIMDGELSEEESDGDGDGFILCEIDSNGWDGDSMVATGDCG